MSYKLINANDITFNSDGFITAKNIEKMPCIYADLPNGMDGEHYVLEQEPTEWQKDHEILKAYSDGADDVLDKVRVEIGKSKTKHEMQLAENDTKGKLLISDIYCDIVNIIDKYRESEG